MPAGSPAWPARLAAARVASELLAPAPVASLLVIAVAWRSAPTALHALRWALVALSCGLLVPVAFIEVGVSLHRFSNRQLSRREERPWPLCVALVAALAALRLLLLAEGPRDLVALLATMAVVLGACLGVTIVWKISMHAAAVAGAAVVVGVLFGWPWLGLAALLVVVAWARVELREHTLGQVLAGSLVGAAGAGLVYSLALAG